jgi:serine/threonine protein kinase
MRRAISTEISNPPMVRRKRALRISDFGLMAPGAGLTSTLTASNMGGGTPLYRAPECVTKLKRGTVQSDIYSFGAILHDISAVELPVCLT